MKQAKYDKTISSKHITQQRYAFIIPLQVLETLQLCYCQYLETFYRIHAMHMLAYMQIFLGRERLIIINC